MTALAQELDVKLKHWPKATRQRVQVLVADIIRLADENALDIQQSRDVEQEVLDIIDEPVPRRRMAG